MLVVARRWVYKTDGATMEHVDANFEDRVELVDDSRYERCTFTRCRVTYRGGRIPAFVDCHMVDCTWHFEEAAERTLRMMHAIYHGLGGGGRDVVEGAFTSIRTPPPRPEAPGAFGRTEIGD